MADNLVLSLLEPQLQPVNDTKVAFSLIICVAGLLGNLLSILIIVVLKEYKKSVTHWYVLQLAIADSVFLLTLPFKVSEDLQRKWNYPEWMCKGKESILFINYYASILFLMVMSIDRYIAICHSFSKYVQLLRSLTSAIIIAIICWAIAIMFSIPVMLYSVKIGLHPHCRCSYEFPKPYVNETERCIIEAFNTTQQIEECLNLPNTAKPHNGELYCRVPDVSAINSVFYEYEQSVSGSGESGYGSGIAAMQGNGSGFAAESGFNDISIGDNIFSNSSLNLTSGDNAGDYFQFLGGGPFDLNNLGSGLHADCHYWNHPTGWIAFIAFNFGAMFLLPFCVMAICYGLIMYKLSATKIRNTSIPSNSTFDRDGRKSQRKSTTTSDSYRRRVTLMCAALVISFVVCWLPFHATHLAKIVGIRVSEQHKSLCRILPEIGSLLAYVNSALNPYLYSFLGTNFSRRLGLMKEANGIRQFVTMAAWKRHDSTSKRQDFVMSKKSSDQHGQQSSGIQPSAPTMTTRHLFTMSKLNTSQSSLRQSAPSVDLSTTQQFGYEQPTKLYDSPQMVRADKTQEAAKHPAY